MTRDNIIFGGLCLVLILIPLPFGGNEDGAIFAFQTATIILFGIHVAGRTFRNGTSEADSSVGRERFPAIFRVFLAVFFIISVFQLIPLPQGLLKILSPHTAGIYEGVRKLGLAASGTSNSHPLSFSVSLSLVDLTRYICFGLYGYLGLRYIATKRRVKIVILLMIFAAIFQTFYGLTEFISGSKRIFGWKNIHEAGGAFGTFINRNHFSGFLEMILPLSLGLLLARIGEPGFFRKYRLKTVFFGALAVVMAIGIFYSRSRGGILSLAGSLFFMLAVFGVQNKRREAGSSKPKMQAIIVGAIALVTVLTVILIGIKPLLERFSKEQLVKTGRADYAVNTLKLIKDYFVFGTGLGTYSYSYKMVERDYGDGAVLNHAHDDYLEVLAESGIIGGGSLIVLALGAFGYLLVKWMKHDSPFSEGVGLGCLAGIFAILIHSLSDFNLRIPANFIYFIILYVLGLRSVVIKSGTPPPSVADIKK